MCLKIRAGKEGEFMSKKTDVENNVERQKRNRSMFLMTAVMSVFVFSGCTHDVSRTVSSDAYSGSALQTSEESASLPETEGFTEAGQEASSQEEIFADLPNVKEFDTIYAYIDGRLYYYDGVVYGMNSSWGSEVSGYADYVGKGIKTEELPDKDMEVRGMTEPYVWYDADMKPVYYYYGGTEPEIYYSEKDQTYYVWDAPYSFKMRLWDEHAPIFMNLTEDERYKILFDGEFPTLNEEQMSLWSERLEQYEPSDTLQDWMCSIKEIFSENDHPLSEEKDYDGQEQYRAYKWDGAEGRIKAEQIIYEILNYYDVLEKREQELYVELDMRADEAERLTGLSLESALKLLEPEKYAHVCFGYVTVDMLMKLCEEGYGTQIYLLNDRKPLPVRGDLYEQLTPDASLEMRVCFFRVMGMYKTQDEDMYYTVDEETGTRTRVITFQAYQPD